MISIEDIKKIREETGISVIQCKKALEEAEGDFDKAKEILKKSALKLAESKSEREIKSGLIYSYVHGGRVGVLLKLNCETDFVAKNEEFSKLAHEIALQITSLNPENVEELLAQDYVKDSSQKIEDMIKGTMGKLGENITVGEFVRLEIGK